MSHDPDSSIHPEVMSGIPKGKGCPEDFLEVFKKTNEKLDKLVEHVDSIDEALNIMGNCMFTFLLAIAEKKGIGVGELIQLGTGVFEDLQRMFQKREPGK